MLYAVADGVCNFMRQEITHRKSSIGKTAMFKIKFLILFEKYWA